MSASEAGEACGPLCVKSDSDWRTLDVAIERAAFAAGGRAPRAAGAAALASVCAAERIVASESARIEPRVEDRRPERFWCALTEARTLDGDARHT